MSEPAGADADPARPTVSEVVSPSVASDGVPDTVSDRDDSDLAESTPSRFDRMSRSISKRTSFARTSVATRLAASVVVISVLSLVVATVVGVTTGRDLADDLNEEHLQSSVESAAIDVAAEIRSEQRATEGLAASLQAAEAVELLDEGFDELRDTIDAEDYDEEFEALFVKYRENYLDPLREAGRDVQLRDVTAPAAAARYLQYEYAIDLGSLLLPATLDDAGDGSAWTEVHQLIHPVYREVVATQELTDLYLVGADGTVLYTVNKRPDLGTNLRTGPYSGSVVSNTYRRAVALTEPGSITSDLQFYDAIPDTPIGVVGSPIFDEDDVVGVLMVSYDATKLTDLVTVDETWEEGGLPETADVYVFGMDGVTRTDPRLFIESPTVYLDAAELAGTLEADERAQIDAIGTTVLTQAIVDGTRDAGIEGDESVRSTDNLVGSSVLSVVVPVPNDGVDWFVVTEVDEGEAGRGLDQFEEILIVGAAIFVVILTFLAVAWATSIVRPIRHISDRISRHGRSDAPIEVLPQTSVEIQQLAGRLGEMKDTLASQQDEMASARDARLSLLRSMLPPSVAARVSSGDHRPLEQAPAASVVVVVVLGLAELVRAGTGSADRELIDRILGELDEMATAHGLERIKVVGDAYYAVCGHDRPYIDHAPRAVAFALEATDAIGGMESPTPISLAVGIQSGPVTTGMAGGASLVYDVWGMTVSQAHRRARQAAGGQVLIGAESQALLPDSIIVESTGQTSLGDATYLVRPAVAGAQP